MIRMLISLGKATPEMIRKFCLDHGWIIIWAIGLLIALMVRPLLPSDETRYVSAAWEMWSRGDFLVPHLNGETYSHKPPLMFWSIHAGWSLFGVNDWWPRLVSPLAGLGAIFAARALAANLWPGKPEVSGLVPWLLTGTLFWSLFGTVTMFDMWNALLATVGLLGVVLAVRGKMVQGFGILGLAIGFGVLAKGPVILLYTLPPVLLAPWWLPSDCTIKLRNWYLATLAAILLGAVIGLCWALPAALAGGDAYAKAIFWGQTAGRVEKSFAHGRPMWWYLPLLPLLLFPWIMWPRLWRLKVALPGREAWPVRLALCWFLPAFIAFSFISGKQPHYLLPMFPALALLAAFKLGEDQMPDERVPDEQVNGRWDQRLPALMVLLTGLVLTLVPASFQVAPDLWMNVHTPGWLADVSPLGGLVLIILAGLMLRWNTGPSFVTIRKMTLVGPVIVAVIHLFVFSAAAPAYDLKAVSQWIAARQLEGKPVAWRKKYHSQFHFLGRLKTPILVVKNQPLSEWFAANPDGVMIMIHRNPPPPGLKARYEQPFRGRYLAIWGAEALATGIKLPE
ncbi:MAG: glycosyltransferase family 39 protein [Alphaproteobacteria bacterium]|nr:glycosyltransferase family 39 protein [Alphaproteobacteria bacterium]MBT4964726.1 glycosyltransferase family 39 protein [Alphaproteobacteria bacterium]